MTLPIALGGQDLIGQAKTGTGKTLGFGIPLLSRIDPGKAAPSTPQALVIVPTRELAVQVASDLTQASAELGATVLSVYGGKAYEPQVEALQKGIDVVVGTPGRLIDLVKQRHLDLSQVRELVLDEADEMLDMGFLPDVELLVSKLPSKRQTMLFSATMPGQIVALARRYMTNPTHIRSTDSTSAASVVDAIEQHVIMCVHVVRLGWLLRSVVGWQDGRCGGAVWCLPGLGACVVRANTCVRSRVRASGCGLGGYAFVG